jgi:hypothetical protein
MNVKIVCLQHLKLRCNNTRSIAVLIQSNLSIIMGNIHRLMCSCLAYLKQIYPLGPILTYSGLPDC